MLAGFAKAIRLAERYVYIEDRGLAPTLPDELVDALRAALPRVQAVVIVTQRDWAKFVGDSWLSDMLLQCAGSTLAQLQAEHPQKLRLYTRADGAYMHSKLLLVDDEYMAVGSANFDTPSLTFQGEFSAAVTDDESVANADGVQVGAAVLTTRLAVWSDQLGRSVEWLRASPLTAALAAFEAADARVRPLQAPAPSPLCRKAAADVFRSLEGRCRDGPDEAPLALVQDGDTIRIDAAEARLDLLGVSADELERRRAAWTPPAHLANRRLVGTQRKYVDSVRSAHYGAVTY